MIGLQDEEKSDHKDGSDGEDTAAQKTCLPQPGRQGRVVFLDGIAHKTYVPSSPLLLGLIQTENVRTSWRAFIMYTYLGPEELTFAPLRSEGMIRARDPGPNKTHACSPKSIYRLAERV